MSAVQWFDAIAKTALEVPGILHAHAAGTAELEPSEEGGRTVEPMIDQLDELPAAFVGHNGADVVAANWQRQTHEILLTIFLERNPIAERYAEAIAFIDSVPAVFEEHARAYNADTNGWLQSLVITRFDGIQTVEFPVRSNRFFLTLPWRLEAKVNRAAEYQPA